MITKNGELELTADDEIMSFTVIKFVAAVIYIQSHHKVLFKGKYHHFKSDFSKEDVSRILPTWSNHKMVRCLFKLYELGILHIYGRDDYYLDDPRITTDFQISSYINQHNLKAIGKKKFMNRYLVD